jgi:4-hydroxybenzoate polyprenyltransferase
VRDYTGTEIIMLKKILKFIAIEFLYNGHLQTWGVLAITIFTSLVFALPITWPSLAILYASFYIIYLYNRWGEREIDALTNPTRTEHVQGLSKQIYFIFAVVFIFMSGLLYFYANAQTIIFVLLITIFGLLYTTHCKKFTRYIPMFKNLYVSGVFALVIFYPFIYDAVPIKDHLVEVLFIAFFIFAEGVIMQILLDVKDIAGDGQIGLKTLGVMIGKEKTLTVLHVLNIVVGVILPLIFIFLGYFPMEFTSIVLLTLINIISFRLAYKGLVAGYLLSGGKFVILPVLYYCAQLLK